MKMMRMIIASTPQFSVGCNKIHLIMCNATLEPASMPSKSLNQQIRWEIVVKAVPTERHARIGKVERAHAILRAVHDKVKVDLPATSKEDQLSLAFRAINDFPNKATGISPTALVFGVNPKIPSGESRGTYAQRIKVVAECTKIVSEIKSKRVITAAKKGQKSVNALDMDEVRKLLPNSEVLVYHDNEGWKLYTLAKVDGNNKNSVLPSGRIGTFGVHNVHSNYSSYENDSGCIDLTPEAFENSYAGNPLYIPSESLRGVVDSDDDYDTAH